MADGIDGLHRVAATYNLDTSRAIVIGHSAGGHLALWAAARPGLPAQAPGASPIVNVSAAISLAGMPDLERAAQQGLSDGAVLELLGGGPEAVPERYDIASPAAQLPVGVPQLLSHGKGDTTVPIDHARSYVKQATTAGDPAELIEIREADHIAMIAPCSQGWQEVSRHLDRLLISPTDQQ